MSASASPLSPSSFDFSGLWVPLVTPFLQGEVDHAALGRLTAHLASTGIKGFVVCGTTGEAAALSPDEQRACLRTVAEHAAGLPLVMGVGGESLAHAQHWVQHLCQASGTQALPPLAGLLVPAPAYIRPSQAGLVQWFRTLADVSTLPLIVYDIPYRTGATLQLDTLLSLAEHPRIQAIKDCGGDLAKTLALVADGRLQVLAGDDLQIFSTVAQGGVGAIAASAHLHTPRLVALLKALAASDLERARALWLPLQPLIQRLFAEPNPGPVKALLAAQGWMHDALRAPMQSASSRLRAELLALSCQLSPVDAADRLSPQ